MSQSESYYESYIVQKLPYEFISTVKLIFPSVENFVDNKGSLTMKYNVKTSMDYKGECLQPNKRKIYLICIRS